jgi:hypothetical protein
MKMKIAGIASVAIAGLALAGCSRAEPRSEEYFQAHLDEAHQVVAKRHAGSTRGEECGNADDAVQIANAEAQRDHFFMKDR